jgi:AraC-like DNA-binding protein
LGVAGSWAQRFAPAEHLRPYVAWYAAYETSGGTPGRHRGLPSADMTMVVAVDRPLQVLEHPDPQDAPDAFETLLGGVHTRANMLGHDGAWAGIQIALRPLGARALFGLPGGELAHHDYHGGDVLGRLASELHQRVNETPDWSDRIRLVDAALTKRLDPERTVDREVAQAWRVILGSHGAVPVGTVAAEIGWSERHLGNRMRIETGVTPKTLARIARFQQACTLIGRDRTRSLAEIAADAGYYDQAHLARDFRDIAGCPPSRWIAEEFGFVQAGPMDLR